MSASYDLAAPRGNECRTNLSRPSTESLILLYLRNYVFCSFDSSRYKQLFRWGAFVSECLGAWQRAHGSDDESDDDSISPAAWAAISAQRKYFYHGRSTNFRARMRNVLIGTVDQYAEQRGVLLLSFPLRTQQTNPYGNYQRKLDYRVRPCLAKWRQNCWWSPVG